jgi:hypothetical protein
MAPLAVPSTPDPGAAMTNEQQRKANVRLALILASVALVFFLGFIAKSAFFG